MSEYIDVTNKRNVPIVGAEIKRILGFTRSGLTGSYITYRIKQGDKLTDIDVCAASIREWYPTVRGRKPASVSAPAPTPASTIENGGLTTLLTELYRTIANMKQELEERDEKIATLTADNAKLRATKRSYAAPPQSVIEAMAVYGR